MSPASSVQLLGDLLSSALAFVRQYQRPVLIGAVIFGTLAALLGGGVANRAAYGVNGMMDRMGIDSQKMEELSLRIQNGDEGAMAEMEVLLNDRLGAMGDGMPSVVKAQIIGLVAPLIGVAILIGIILAVFGHAYFLLLALSPTQDFMKILNGTPKLFFPLLGIWIWMFLRSFIWIPILGIIPAVMYGPRFMLAPVIMVKEKKKIMESVSLSYARTEGYWGKIVGNVIVAALCIMLAAIVVAIVAGIIGFIIPLAGLWLQSVARFVFSAFMVAFIVQLAFTIMANPMGEGKKAKK